MELFHALHEKLELTEPPDRLLQGGACLATGGGEVCKLVETGQKIAEGLTKGGVPTEILEYLLPVSYCLGVDDRVGENFVCLTYAYALALEACCNVLYSEIFGGMCRHVNSVAFGA